MNTRYRTAVRIASAVTAFVAAGVGIASFNDVTLETRTCTVEGEAFEPKKVGRINYLETDCGRINLGRSFDADDNRKTNALGEARLTHDDFVIGETYEFETTGVNAPLFALRYQATAAVRVS